MPSNDLFTSDGASLNEGRHMDCGCFKPGPVSDCAVLMSTASIRCGLTGPDSTEKVSMLNCLSFEKFWCNSTPNFFKGLF